MHLSDKVNVLYNFKMKNKCILNMKMGLFLNNLSKNIQLRWSGFSIKQTSIILLKIA